MRGLVGQELLVTTSWHLPFKLILPLSIILINADLDAARRNNNVYTDDNNMEVCAPSTNPSYDNNDNNIPNDPTSLLDNGWNQITSIPAVPDWAAGPKSDDVLTGFFKLVVNEFGEPENIIPIERRTILVGGPLTNKTCISLTDDGTEDTYHAALLHNYDNCFHLQDLGTNTGSSIVGTTTLAYGECKALKIGVTFYIGTKKFRIMRGSSRSSKKNKVAGVSTHTNIMNNKVYF